MAKGHTAIDYQRELEKGVRHCLNQGGFFLEQQSFVYCAYCNTQTKVASTEDVATKIAEHLATCEKFGMAIAATYYPAA
jgi:hypothetical protein